MNYVYKIFSIIGFIPMTSVKFLVFYSDINYFECMFIHEIIFILSNSLFKMQN